MCNYPCLTAAPEQSIRKLTPLLLDCWQREYDKRPYRYFIFDRLKFEERLGRNFDSKLDFATIVMFLRTRSLRSIKLAGFTVPNHKFSIVNDFVESLWKLRCIELKLMNLPTIFYRILSNNAEKMKVLELSLEGSPLNDDDIDYLHSFIIKSKTLHILNVSNCSINQYNFAQLADGIQKSQTLNDCNVSHLLGHYLTIDSEKIAHILASLIGQNKLEKLELENCGLLGHDMEIIGEHLYKQNSKLETLNVAYNKIGAKGVWELLKSISASKTLKHLNISGCSLGTHGGELVAQYLSSCWNLKSLSLRSNNIEAEAVNLILLCMKKSCELQKLHIFGNKFNPRTGQILRRLLESGVLPQDYIDVTVTFDDTIPGYSVIPWLP